MYWGHHYWEMHAFWGVVWLLLLLGALAWVWARSSEGGDEDAAKEEQHRRYAAGSTGAPEYEHRLSGGDSQTHNEEPTDSSSSANALGKTSPQGP